MSLSKEEIAQLIAQARCNQSEAWEPLFRRFQLPLLAYCQEILFSREDALDAVQQSFLKAIKYLPSLRQDSKFGSWLFGIARQECIDLIRRKGRRERLEPAHSFADEVSVMCPSERATRSDDARQVILLVRELEPDLSEPMILFYLEEFSIEAIAEVMQLPSGTIKSRLHRARKTIKLKMEEAHALAR